MKIEAFYLTNTTVVARPCCVDGCQILPGERYAKVELAEDTILGTNQGRTFWPVCRSHWPSVEQRIVDAFRALPSGVDRAA